MNLIEGLKFRIYNLFLSPKYKSDINNVNRIGKFLTERENSKDYRDYVADLYKSKGYSVWEYHRDDRDLDLVLKKGKFIYFAICKDDNRNISLDDVLDFEIDMELFLKEYSLFNGYRVKFLYILSGFFLEEDAFSYIKSSDRVTFKVIKGDSIYI